MNYFLKLLSALIGSIYFYKTISKKWTKIEINCFLDHSLGVTTALIIYPKECHYIIHIVHIIGMPELKIKLWKLSKTTLLWLYVYWYWEQSKQ